ncbi:MAG: caspase family protein [Isosphaeraceae bacterium]
MARFRTCLGISLATACLLALAGPARGQGKIDLLIVCDTDSKLQGVERDGRQVRNIFEKGILDTRLLRATTLQGAQVHPNQILDYYRRVAIGPDDTLVFYYSGHGAIDPDRGQAMTTERGVLFRRDLQALMESRRARLNVILTDCCSNIVVLPPAGVAAAPMASAPQTPPLVDPLLRQLFLEHRGTVCITAASPGESAWGDNDLGGYFTASITSSLRFGDPKGYDNNGDGFAGWDEVFPEIREGARMHYAMFRNRVLQAKSSFPARLVRDVEKQSQQTPSASIKAVRSAAVPTDRFIPNLGVFAEFVPYGYALGLGMKITRPPQSGSALLAAGIGVGDMIVEMDELPIRHPVDVLSHVEATPAVVIDGRSGGKRPVQLQLPKQVFNADWAPPERLAKALGLYYRLVPLGSGLYGARLSRTPYGNAPVNALRLEICDMIVELDGQSIRGPDDVANHVGETDVRFINIRTGYPDNGKVRLPAQVVR